MSHNDSGSKARITIIYNADASVRGKVTYAYKKLFPTSGKGSDASSDGPVCGNCDITHGGLSLSETTAWSSKKGSLENELNVKIEQRHRDELDGATRTFVKEAKVRFPAILLTPASSASPSKVLLDRASINACALVEQDSASSIEEARAEELAKNLRQALAKEREATSSQASNANL